MNFEEFFNEGLYEEGKFKNFLAKAGIAGMLAADAGYGLHKAVQDRPYSAPTEYTQDDVTSNIDDPPAPYAAPVNPVGPVDKKAEQKKKDLIEIANYISKHEGYKRKTYPDSKGYKTIGIGHWFAPTDKQLFKRLFGNDFDYDAVHNGTQEMTDEQIKKLFIYDLQTHENLARKLIPKYDTFSTKVKAAILDGVFRGDLSGSKETIAHINKGNWTKAADEYLDNVEYRKSAAAKKHGVAPRMRENAAIFKQMSLKK